MEALAGLNIWCNDNTYGNYFVYDQGNKLLEQYNVKQARRLSALFSIESGLNNEEEQGSLLTEAESITWTFPTSKTMITMNDVNYNHSYQDQNGKNYIVCQPKDNIRGATYEIDEDKLYNITYEMLNGDIYFYDHHNQTISVTRYGAKAEGYAIDATQLYFIGEKWLQEYGRNNIQCSIVKNNKKYYTSKTLHFGQAGTSGTDSTLVIYIDPADAFALDITQKTLNLRAILFNSQNQEVNLKNVANDNLDFEWKWYCYTLGDSSIPNVEIVPTVLSERGDDKDYNMIISNKLLQGGELKDNPIYYKSTARNLVTIQDPTNTVNMNQLLIVECTVKNWGDYPLTTYKAIPLKNGNTYSYVDCASEVIYLTSGYPDYYKGSWSIYLSGVDEDNDGYEDQDLSGTWEIFNPFNENLNYIAKFSKSNILQPIGIYMPNISPYGAQYKINGKSVWTQPIVCLQNNYPSSTLNQWTGDSIEIDNDNGYILAPAIAAGKKNSDDNTFSGVMLGDWNYVDGQSKEITKQTGVYGFHHGAMSYAFKEDGTAFIGKSGKGRILFDGNESTISSESYSKLGAGGILIDLDDGYIDIKDSNNKTRFYASGGNVKNQAKPYFEVVGNSQKLITISSTEYFLQSDNYNWNAGTKIDMQNGTIDSNDFYLRAIGAKGIIVINSNSTGGSYERLTYVSGEGFKWETVSTNDYPFEIKGDNGVFKVGWAGDIYANYGEIGNFKLTDHSLYTKENEDSPTSGKGIYIGQAVNKNGNRIPEKVSFSLGDKFRYDEQTNKLFIASNLYRPTTKISDDGIETTKSYFMFGINNNGISDDNDKTNPRLQIGAAVSDKAGYDGISMYGNGGDIYLIPQGTSVDDYGLKVGLSEISMRFESQNKKYLIMTPTSFKLQHYTADQQEGIYARFA